MYFRFVIPEWDHRCRAQLGFFHATYWLCRDPELRNRWEQQALRDEINWFEENLDAPQRFTRRLGGHGVRHGICWFQPDAHEHINRARYCSWLMNELGTYVHELRTPNPGLLVWQDNLQAVAIDAKGPHRAC